MVIPSPSIVQRRESTDDELIGISEKFFPIDVHEKRAAKGTYPSAKHVDRKKASLDITPHAPAAKSVKSLDSTASIQSSINAQLVKTLRAKLAVIDGPKVTVAPKDELALALAVENFQFVNSYQLRAGVKRAPESFNSGCTCGVFCNPAFCSCLELKDEQDRKISPYVRSPRDQKTFVLSPWFLNMKSKLMECNSRCGCKGSCWNAVAQSRKISLQIFHTGNRGFGKTPFDPLYIPLAKNLKDSVPPTLFAPANSSTATSAKSSPATPPLNARRPPQGQTGTHTYSLSTGAMTSRTTPTSPKTKAPVHTW